MTHDSHTPVIARLRQEPWQSHFLPQSALRLTAPSEREPWKSACTSGDPVGDGVPDVPRGEDAASGLSRTPAPTDTHRTSGGRTNRLPPRGGSCRRVRRRALHFAAAPMRTSSISASAFFLSETNKLVCFGGGRSTFAVALAVLCAAEPTCASRSDGMRVCKRDSGSRSVHPHPTSLTLGHLPPQGGRLGDTHRTAGIAVGEGLAPPVILPQSALRLTAPSEREPWRMRLHFRREKNCLPLEGKVARRKP